MRKTLEERFWAKVKKTDGCWEWQVNPSGYHFHEPSPYVSMSYGLIGHKGKTLRAHRVSWEIHFGPIPEGLFVCHHCDNKMCVRPDHLFLGTRSENAQDMIRKMKEAGSRNRYHAERQLLLPRGQKPDVALRYESFLNPSLQSNTTP